MQIIILIITLIYTNISLAGRPVIHQINRDQLIQQSDFIFSGWPSQQPAINNCSTTILGKWQIHKVYKGNKSLEGKIIAIAPSNYQMIGAATKENSKGASFAQSIYKNGEISFEQSTSFIFAKSNSNDCFELTANGAQEHRFKEIELEALLDHDCNKSVRAIENILSSLPKNCETEKDCVEKNLYPDKCKMLQIYNSGAEKLLDENWPSIKNTYFQNCQEIINSSGICPEQRTHPLICQNRKCQIGLPDKQIEKLPSFDKATILHSCAPNDAPAIAIHLENSKNKFPFFALDWWGKGRPVVLKGSYELHERQNINSYNDFSYRYYIAQGVCNKLNEINLKIEMKNDLEGEIDYEIETNSNKKLKGKIPLKFTRLQI